jgi:hypothetical protein
MLPIDVSRTTARGESGFFRHQAADENKAANGFGSPHFSVMMQNCSKQ